MSTTHTSITLELILVIVGGVIALGSVLMGATPVAAVGMMLIVAGLVIAASRWWQRRRTTS